MRLRSMERDFRNTAGELEVLRRSEAELRVGYEKLEQELAKVGEYAHRLEAALQQRESPIAELEQAPGPKHRR